MSFVSLAGRDDGKGEDMKRLIVGVLVAIGLLFPGAVSGSYISERRLVMAAGHSVSVTLVRFPQSAYRIGVALAGVRVGDNAFLLEIAQRAGGVCAINGTFLAAYTGETGEPYGTLVIDGKVLHLGSVGTRLDILATGKVRLNRDGLQIRGGLDGNFGYPANWYAYNINQTSSSSGTGAYVFTPEHGPSLGFRAELAIVARKGKVTDIQRGQDVSIPTNGFVFVLQGREVKIQGWKFSIGQQIEYRVMQDGVPLDVLYSLGAGPKLIDDGNISANPVAEGFVEAKIVSLRSTRSVVGLTETGEILLVALDSATMIEAASVMKTLGAVKAMNLDGGASSGLVCDGAYLVHPGRAVANALVVWPKR